MFMRKRGKEEYKKFLKESKKRVDKNTAEFMKTIAEMEKCNEEMLRML